MAESQSAKRAGEAFLMALQGSPAAEILSEDAVAAVRGAIARWEDPPNLNDAWKLLSLDTEFEPAKLRPSFCQLKLWESRLGVTINLPSALSSLSEEQIKSEAEHVNVDPQEIARILRGGGSTGRSARGTHTPPAAQRVSAAKQESQRRLKGIVAGVVIVGCLAFIGLYLNSLRGSRSWDTLAKDFAEGIPLKSAQRSGIEVSATLASDDWLSENKSTRSSQMSAALRELPAGVKVFFVRDTSGAIRAAARWYGNPPDVAVSYR